MITAYSPGWNHSSKDVFAFNWTINWQEMRWRETRKTCDNAPRPGMVKCLSALLRDTLSKGRGKLHWTNKTTLQSAKTHFCFIAALWRRCSVLPISLCSIISRWYLHSPELFFISLLSMWFRCCCLIKGHLKILHRLQQTFETSPTS